MRERTPGSHPVSELDVRLKNWRRRLAGALALALHFVLLVFVSFFLLWVGDKINAQGMAVTRFMARVQAPLASEFAYPDTGRDQISVVMYDGDFLASQGAAWPISYQDHADWIGRLVEVPGAKPKALLIDITFGQARDDPSVAALRDKLCEIRRVHGIPVFLAALPDPQSGRLSVRHGLGTGDGSKESDCFTLVGVDYLPDALDGVAWTYQLRRYFDGQSWMHGQPASESESPGYRSAALALAEDVGGLRSAVHEAPMAMVWGYASAPQADRSGLGKDCRPGESSWRHWIPRVFSQLWEANDGAPLCPYHRTLSFAQVAELDESGLASFVGGKYVLVGANVPGHNDFANSPVHGLLPGVHMHAMALDNFLTYGRDYKVSAEWSLPPPGALFLPGLASIAIVFLVHLVWEAIRAPWGRCIQRLSPHRMCEGARRRVIEAGLTGAAWALRIALQSAVSILLLALLQKWSRIGTLPVVELVGMTLVAEGLGTMSWIKWLISGEPAKTD
jgi:hypothetical protein